MASRHPYRRSTTRICTASTTRCHCRPLQVLLRAITGRYVVTFSYLMPIPALASALSRAKVCWGGQLLRTGFGVDPSSAVLNLAGSAACADHPSAMLDMHLDCTWLHDAHYCRCWRRWRLAATGQILSKSSWTRRFLLSRSLRSSPTLPHARGSVRRRPCSLRRSLGFKQIDPSVSPSLLLNCSRPTILTTLSRQTAPLQHARLPRARRHSASLIDAITAESVVASFARKILLSRSV